MSLSPAASASTVCIRPATADDEPALFAFLEQHWKAGHVFVRQPELFRWQHAVPGQPTGRNFTLGVDEETNELLAIQGFIPLRRFDPQLPCHDAFLAIWKIREDAGHPGLGLKLYQTLLERRQPTMVSVIGLSQMVIPLYRALRFQVGLFEHHVFFNRRRQQFIVADGVPELSSVPVAESSFTLRTACTESEVPAAVSLAIDQFAHSQRPQKSWAFLTERYLRHPVYEYRLSWLSRDGRPSSAFVWRRQEAGDTAVLRIVDVFGPTDQWPMGASRFQELLMDEDAEYLDVYHHGLTAVDLEAAGFTNRRQTPGLIVPNYFQPYLRQNVDLDFGYRFYGPATGPVRLFRGDADQDRPNEPYPFRRFADRPAA